MEIQLWWLSGLEQVSNSSRHSLKDPEFESCSRHFFTKIGSDMHGFILHFLIHISFIDFMVFRFLFEIVSVFSSSLHLFIHSIEACCINHLTKFNIELPTWTFPNHVLPQFARYSSCTLVSVLCTPTYLFYP